MEKKFSDTTIIIPTFNESLNIGRIIKELLKLYPDINIIVSDDGSKDETQTIVELLNEENKNVKLLNRSEKFIKGLTVSVMDAVLTAKSKYVITMDSDFQHPPEKVTGLIEALRKDNDVVVAVRKKLPKEWSLLRKLMSFTAEMMGEIRLILTRHPRATDVVSGFFGAKTLVFKKAINEKKHRFEFKGYKVLFDLLKVLPKSAKIAEVPYNFQLREKGESKIRMKHIIYYLKSLAK